MRVGDRPNLRFDALAVGRARLTGQFGDAVWQALEFRHSSVTRSGERSPQLSQTQPEQVHDRDLAQERLGRRDTDLQARTGEARRRRRAASPSRS